MESSRRLYPAHPALAWQLFSAFIPGVGAMYNGQYAKGIIHLIVFAILVSLANDVNGIFGLFIAGWVIYQIIDANHTARARLAGTPLPNPFGLNEIGERLGFGKAWPAAAPTTLPQRRPPPQMPPPPHPPPYTPPASNWGAQPKATTTPSPPAPRYHLTAHPIPATTPTPPSPPRSNRFPTGAIWLIGLGAFFLIANTGLFHGFPSHILRSVPPHRIRRLALHPQDDRLRHASRTTASPMYRMRLSHALRGPIWIILVGVMFLLASLQYPLLGKELAALHHCRRPDCHLQARLHTMPPTLATHIHPLRSHRVRLPPRPPPSFLSLSPTLAHDDTHITTRKEAKQWPVILHLIRHPAPLQDKTGAISAAYSKSKPAPSETSSGLSEISIESIHGHAA